MARFKFPSKIWPDSARFQSLFSASSLWPDGTTSYHYPPEILIQSFLVIVTKHSIRKFLYIVVQNGNFLLKIRTQFFLLLHFMVILFSSRQGRKKPLGETGLCSKRHRLCPSTYNLLPPCESWRGVKRCQTSLNAKGYSNRLLSFQLITLAHR